MAKLEQYPNMKFIWAEISYLSMWWVVTTMFTCLFCLMDFCFGVFVSYILVKSNFRWAEQSLATRSSFIKLLNEGRWFFFLVVLFFVYFLASLSLIQWWLFLSSVFLFFVFVSVCHSRHLNNQNLRIPGWNLWYEIEETFLFYIFLFLERISFFLCLWQLPLVSLSLCLFASLFITHSILTIKI